MQNQSKIIESIGTSQSGITSWIGKVNWINVFGYCATATGFFTLFSFFVGNGSTQADEITPNTPSHKGVIRTWIGRNWGNILRITAEATGISKKHPKVYFGNTGTAHQGEHSGGPLKIHSDLDSSDISTAPKTIPNDTAQTADTIFNNIGTATQMTTTGELTISTTIRNVGGVHQ